MAHDLDTKLITQTIGGLSEAAKVVGNPKKDHMHKYSPMVLRPDRSACTFWISIPEGFYALISSHGRYVAMWEAGLHYVKPWEKVSHLVTKQYVVYDTPVKECPTADNVMVVIDVSSVIHVRDSEQDVKNFVFGCSPQQLDSLLRAFQEEAVRSMARLKKYSNIYDLMDTEELNNPAAKKGEGEGEEHKSSEDADDDVFEVNEQLENTKRSINAKLHQYGINMHSITITNVHLPQEFRRQMEDATTFDSKNIEQEARQKYSMQVIDDTEGLNKANQRLGELKEEHNEANKQKCAEERKLTNTFEAGTSRILADINETMQADVLRIKTQSDLTEARLRKEKEAELERIAAEATASTRQIKAETAAFVTVTRSAAQAKVAANAASTLKLEAHAEHVASTKLVAKRDFEQKMAHLRILKNLALNQKLTLSGSNNDNPVAQMLASQQAGAVLGLNVQR